jgi:hypothetical protein
VEREKKRRTRAEKRERRRVVRWGKVRVWRRAARDVEAWVVRRRF